jgi:predicted GNAT family acetyltransferase
MTQETASSAAVRDNAQERRYELPIDSRHAAFVEYRLMDGVIIFTHAETPPQFEGRGFGSMLAKGALDAARDRGLKVIPHCSFIAAYIRRHPEYSDLLPTHH